METIFLASDHCGNGPILTAGSVFVKSGLCSRLMFLLATASAWYIEYEPPCAPIAVSRQIRSSDQRGNQRHKQADTRGYIPHSAKSVQQKMLPFDRGISPGVGESQKYPPMP